jgi:hypothetical protein
VTGVQTCALPISAKHLQCALNIHPLTHYAKWNGLAEGVNSHVAAAFEYVIFTDCPTNHRLSAVLEKHISMLASNGPSMNYVDAYKTALLEIIKQAQRI